MAVAKKKSGFVKIDPNAQYDVSLKRSVKHGATWLRPNANRLRLKGQTVIDLGDAVTSYELVK